MKKMVLAFAAAGLFAVGCNNSPVASDSGDSSGGTATGAQYVASSEPADAIAVGDARESVEDAEEVTLVGRIGGSTKPFVDGLAAFTIVDPKVPHCAPEEGCPTPWDYCCETDQVKENIATVKVVDDSGKPVADDARELLDVEELSMVVVQGKAQRDDQGNLSVLARKVFVRPAE